MKTSNAGFQLRKDSIVYILPLRNENSVADGRRSSFTSVYILPLRNENLVTTNHRWPPITGLYPTFKEWKHMIWFWLSSTNGSVYILPLRNENWWSCQRSNTIYDVYILPLRNENSFLTPAILTVPFCLYPTFKEWKPRYCFLLFSCDIVYILPLRNENNNNIETFNDQA